MLRRLYLMALLLTFPAVLVGCPDDDPSLGDQIEEGLEEVGDEVDDAL